MYQFGRRLLAFTLALVLTLGALATPAYALPVEKESPKVTTGDKLSPEQYQIAKQQWIAERERDAYSTLSETSEGTIGNSYIGCYIHSNGGFNIGTADGDCLLYNYPGGNTSQTLIRIDAVDYFFDGYVTDIQFGSDGKSCTATATIDGVTVQQILTIVKNPNATTENVISIKYVVQNDTATAKTVGVRIMLDTMLGSNDGAPFKINGNSVTTEVEYQGDNIPKLYQAVDSLTNPSITATGYFAYPGATMPDKVQFAYWGQISGYGWNYQVNASRVITGDSAVAAYFNERSLPAGDSLTVATYYGAHDVSAVSAYDPFHYSNTEYSQELAEICARYSALAYEGYHRCYSTLGEYFYDNEDDGKADVKNNDRSTVLYNFLDNEDYKGIKPYNYKNPSENSATYTLAYKKVNHNGQLRYLILVVVRGTNKDEWKGNMNVTGTSYASQAVHDSFQNGATQIQSALMRYMNTYTEIQNPMVLITGHSRGGAIGNLLAADLVAGRVSRIDTNAVYAYLFAVPNCTTSPNTSMQNIYNFCFTDDFVPSLPLNEKWNYGKHGTTFTASADDQSTSTTFYELEKKSLNQSLGRAPSFDEAKKDSVIKYVKDNWKSVSAYYNQTAFSTVASTLYEFMHDTVAPAAMGKFGDSVAMKYATGSPTYGKIAKFFVDGWSMRKSINDTHQMFTYFNALTTGVFAAAGASASVDYTSDAVRTVADNSAEEQAALLAFANTDSNLELLGWTAEDTSTWTGITWDENGRVAGISLCYLGLTGSLDLTAFNCLTEVDISGNQLEVLILPEAETSILNWLDCSYNNLKALDIAGQPLQLLDCSGNFLDAAAMAEASASIPNVSCGEQKPVEAIVFSEADCAVLTSRVLLNSELWDITADPSEWRGVSWVNDNGIYYVDRLELAECGLSGVLDVSGLAHLNYLNCGSNSLTAIDATGCNALVFLNCTNNEISQLTVTSQLTTLYCNENYLEEEDVENLGAETTYTGHQGVSGEVDAFCEAEYAVLASIAEALGVQTENPGDWSFVSWEKFDGIYYARSLDVRNRSEVAGDLDLSGFEYLEDIALSATEITSVVLPDHMTALTERAFSNCNALTQVQLPKNLTTIGAYAFYGCGALENISFPTGLKNIGQKAFAECSSLKKVVLGAAVETIEEAAFQNCMNLEAAYFTGNAPQCAEDAFLFATAGFTVYHLENSTGWDDAAWYSYFVDDVDRLSITNYPDQQQFFVGDELDTSGLELLLLNTDGTYLDITEGFTVSCDAFEAAGTYTVTVSYDNESVTYDVIVLELSIENAYFYMENSVFDYTGEEIRPELTVTFMEETLIEGEDYTLSYENNIEPGQGLIRVTGINRFTGESQIYFQILYRGAETVTDWTELESPHNYYDSTNWAWTYYADNENAAYIRLTFDDNTVFENSYDWLEFYDAAENLFASYTGDTLAGATIYIPGNAVTLRLVTDSSVAYWGFKVTDLKELILQDVEVSISSAEVPMGATAQITASGYGAFSYTSSDETIATVDENGLVTGVGCGTAVITVTAAGDDTYYQDSEDITVTVTEADPIPVVKVSNVASTGKIQLSWNAVPGAVKYEVYRATSKNGTYTLLKTLSGTKLTNTSTTAGKTYYYKVRSVAADGTKSEFSEIVYRTCDLARPVVTVSNVASTGKIRITWKAVPGAVKYQVYRSTDKENWTLLKTTTGTKLTNTSVEAGTLYYYKVKAIASISAANSAFSTVKSRRCDLARPVVTLSNVASTGKIKISWKKIEGAVKYEVYRSTDNKTWTLLKTVSGTSLTNTSTTAGKLYYYKVRAIASNSEANSAFSTVKSRRCDLARPTLTVTKNSKDKPYLSWTKISGAVKYEVYRSTDGKSWTLLKTTTGTKLTHSSAAAGTTYYYRVRAIASSSSANSAYSTVKSVKAG